MPHLETGYQPLMSEYEHEADTPQESVMMIHVVPEPHKCMSNISYLFNIDWIGTLLELDYLSIQDFNLNLIFLMLIVYFSSTMESYWRLGLILHKGILSKQWIMSYIVYIVQLFVNMFIYAVAINTSPYQLVWMLFVRHTLISNLLRFHETWSNKLATSINQHILYIRDDFLFIWLTTNRFGKWQGANFVKP